MDRTCKQCSASFTVSESEQDFYRRISVPPPVRCFSCRLQRRLSFRNERNLYHRKCSLTGKQIISAFSPEVPFPVYDIDAWWTDDWDPPSFGLDYDPNRSFFDQLLDLRNRVPRLSLQQQRPMENSTYCNCASKNRNCYLTFSTNHCEDCYYGSWVNYSRDCVDVLNVEGCELCYECVNCRDCYNLRYSRDCTSCADSFFLRDCLGCKHCFGCTSRVQGEYLLFNEPVGKERFEEFMRSINLCDRREVERLQREIEQTLGIPFVKQLHGTNLESCSGEYLRNCKNTTDSYQCDNSEDLKFCVCINRAKSCMDFSYWGQDAELIYDCQACGYEVFNLRYCNLCWSGCRDLTYCDHCFSIQSCFGCVGLKHGHHAVLNKSYTAHEYERMTQRIVADMEARGEWGEFFPERLSPFPYNETLAHEEYPLTRKDAEARGWHWSTAGEHRKNDYIGGGKAAPDDIGEVTDEILTQVFVCESTGKPFKLVKPELSFYRRQGIPLPRHCPDARHLVRLQLRNPRFLWKRSCANCKTSMETPYAPGRPERVLCDRCYQQRVFG